MNAKLNKLLDRFAEWLVSKGYAYDKFHADRLAWDFIVGAFDDDDNLQGWIDAYEDMVYSCDWDWSPGDPDPPWAYLQNAGNC